MAESPGELDITETGFSWLVIANVRTAGPLYVSESSGSDESGRGTEEQPFKTILQVSFSVHGVVYEP